ISGGLLAGALIAAHIDKILLIPGLFILLPGFLEMRGNVSGALAARFGTALDLKFIPPRIRGNKVVSQNIFATFVEVLIVALSLAAIAYFVTYFLFGNATLEIFAVAVIAALVSNIIEATLTTITTFQLYKMGHDPNNIMGPYVTTTGDIISVFSLLLAVFVIAGI
ncbi:MAG: magnesium transporter, partial [Candidatus Nanoarchaeia archaeon]